MSSSYGRSLALLIGVLGAGLGGSGCDEAPTPRLEADSAQRSVYSLEDGVAELQLDPTNTDARLAYAETLASLGHFDRAIAQCDTVLHSSVNRPRALCLRGAVLLQTGAYDAALADLDSALARDSMLASGWSNRGQVLFGRGDLAAAVQCYDRALKCDPARALVHYNRALALDRLGQPEATIEAFRRYLMESPPLRELSRRQYARDRLAQLLDSGRSDQSDKRMAP